MVIPDLQRHFTAKLPRRTHYRPATCDEIDCEQYLRGWVTIVPSGSDHETIVRGLTGYKWTEERQDGGLIAFTFPPGQRCFRSDEHRIQTGRPPIVADSRNRLVRTVPEFTDSYNDHVTNLQDERRRG